MADDLFKPSVTLVVDPNKDYLSELVGDDKKFKTPGELARAKAESDAFIERLKQEAAGLRSELSSRMQMEAILTQLESVTKPAAPSNEPAPQAREREQASSAVNPEVDIEKMVSQKLAEAQNKRDRDANVSAVTAKLKQAYGENYASQVKSVADRLGVGTDFLSDLASSKPAAFFKLIGLDEQPTRRSDIFAPPSSVTGVSNPNAGNKTWGYYEGIRKADKTKYYSPAIQNEMFNQLKELGDDFYKS